MIIIIITIKHNNNKFELYIYHGSLVSFSKTLRILFFCPNCQIQQKCECHFDICTQVCLFSSADVRLKALHSQFFPHFGVAS